MIGQVLQCRQREEVVLIEESQLTAAVVCCKLLFFLLTLHLNEAAAPADSLCILLFGIPDLFVYLTCCLFLNTERE